MNYRIIVFENQRQNDFLIAVVLRIIIYIAYVITDDAYAFRRKIQPEETWLYSFPHAEVDIVSAQKAFFLLFVSSISVVWGIYKFNKDFRDAVTALLGVFLSTFLSLTITNLIKISVGRPRPDFFERCFSVPPLDPHELAQAQCDRSEDLVNQGYKSFPSGHAAMSFGCMAYLSCYLALGLKLFTQPGHRLPTLRLCLVLTPLMMATLVCVSRTCDYHHHWQDVLVGGMIGTLIAYSCFRQGFQCFTTKESSSHRGNLSPPPLTVVQSY